MPIGINNTSGDFLSVTGVSKALNETNHYEYDPTVSYTDPDAGPSWNEDTDIGDAMEEDPSLFGTMFSNFLDSMTNTGFASAVQTLWANLWHTQNIFMSKPALTQTDIDYVKNALPNDEEAQNYVLTHGHDVESVHWLVNQKLVDKQRRQEIEQWKEGNQGLLSRFLVGASGAAGYLVDPTMLIGATKAFTAVKMASRLGEGLTNLAKAKQITSYATKVGAVNTATVMADDYLRDKAGGQKVDYGFDAAIGFLVGATLGATGGFVSALKRGRTATHQAETLDVLESRAYEDAADVSHVPKGKDGKPMETTYDSVSKLHQPDFADRVKSKMYESFEANQRVIAANSKDIRQLIMDRSGIEVPEDAKAIYVPNEDYAIVFTDKVKPNEVESILTHEFGVHAGLQRALGDKAYTRLMNKVTEWANREDSVFHEARRAADTYDPEEILAKVVEDGKLNDSTWETLKQGMNKVLQKEGSSIQLNMKQVKEIMQEQAQMVKTPLGYHVNADGSTAFAGIRYSKDNILNPENLGRYIQLEQRITQDTQKDMFTHLPSVIAKPLRSLSKGMEQGIFGLGINSVSNTLRKFTPQIWQDARGRGLGGNKAITITAEENKQRILGLLYHDYAAYGKIRAKWCFHNLHVGRGGQMMFDKMVVNAYNAKYAGNVATVLKDLPPEVGEAVEQLKKFRENMIELGKRSADDVGATADNLIEKEWYAVDHELHRAVDNDLLVKFRPHFNNQEDALDFLEDYIRKGVTKDKFEVIRQKLERNIVMENAKIERANQNIPANSAREPQPLKPVHVTDDEVQQFIDDNARATAEGWTRGAFDLADARNLSSLGNLDFLRMRMPIDTTHVMEMPDGTKFSFDENLRSYDMDNYTLKSISRFAGEAALKNVFENQKAMDDFLKRVGQELDLAVTNRKITPRTRNQEMKQLESSIAEFRGTRPPDEIGLGRMGAITKIFRNLAYGKYGANMGFNQIGEAGGTIAYGGATQLFHVFPPLGRFVEKIKLGKETTQTLRDADDYLFGSSLENEIWTMNYGDRTIRDALSTDNLIDKAITWVGDKSANLGKLTSTINFLPKMTDAMVRGMRVQTMMDSIRAAHGEKIGNAFRQPFSKAKLKASHISDEDFQAIKDGLKEYTTMKDGQVVDFDYDAWHKADPTSFMKWWGLIQTQSERGIVSATKQGNKNLLKNSSPFWQLVFQFKDYNLRAINAQTFRAMTAGDMDDAMATGLSIVMNMAAYAGRVGLTYGMLKASGATQKAEDYYKQMFDDETLMRAAATRSTIAGTLPSFANDIYEMVGGAPSVRTTVTRKSQKKERDIGDMIGDAVGQLPAVREMGMWTVDLGRVIEHTADEPTKRDMRKFFRILPVPNMIPFYTYTNSLVENSSLRR